MARILVLAESAAQRALVRKTLLVEGLQVVEAASTADAIVMLGRSHIDVVVLEAGTSAEDVLRAMRGVDAYERTPVVVLGEPDAVSTSALASYADIGVIPVGQPFSAGDLRVAVARALETAHAAREIVLDEAVEVVTLEDDRIADRPPTLP